MNIELLSKLIPQRRVFDSPREPRERLMDLHRSLADLRELLATDASTAIETRAELEKQLRLYEEALE